MVAEIMSHRLSPLSKGDRNYCQAGSVGHPVVYDGFINWLKLDTQTGIFRIVNEVT